MENIKSSIISKLVKNTIYFLSISTTSFRSFLSDFLNIKCLIFPKINFLNKNSISFISITKLFPCFIKIGSQLSNFTLKLYFTRFFQLTKILNFNKINFLFLITFLNFLFLLHNKFI